MPRIFSFRLQCGRPNAAITLRRKSSATRTRITRRCSGGTGDTALAIGVNERSSGLDDDRNVTLSLLFGWPIMLPERMCAGRASSSGEAGGPTIVAAHGPVVAGPNAGTRITTRDVNPTPPAAFTLNSAKASTVLLRCCRARVCKGYNREKADGQQITHCICPSVDGFHPVGEPQPMRISQGQSRGSQMTGR